MFQSFVTTTILNHVSDYKDACIEWWNTRNLTLPHVLSAYVLGIGSATVVQWDVDSYIRREGPIAKASLLANIGSNGSRALGVPPGVVIASPSTEDPNYFYSWTRDSALVFKYLVDEFISGRDPSLRDLIDDFVIAGARFQQIPSRSGCVSSGGLGEPKFYTNFTAFEDSWGRPQRDGPALRSMTIIAYAHFLLRNGDLLFVNETIWPILQLDLDYVAETWNRTTYDLWEEVSSSSFFTTAVQHRMLRDGAILAKKLGRTRNVAELTAQADNTLCFLQTYWNPVENFMTANTGGGRSGKDSNTNLASAHTFDPEAGCDPVTFQPCSDRALASLKAYIDSFRGWPINSGIPRGEAIATGRYVEDIYYGGNPWYLCTFAVAEQLYYALYVWSSQRWLEVTPISQAFFRQFSPDVAPGNYSAGAPDNVFDVLTEAIKTHADAFIAVNARYTPLDGSLSEQYSKTDGTPMSAKYLTWSYAAALTAFGARNGTNISANGWGARGLVVPSVCQSHKGLQVQVTFNVEKDTKFGEDIFLVGSTEELKSWSPKNAIPLSYTQLNGKPVWTAKVQLTASEYVEYKYILKFRGQVTWESDPNRRFTTPTSGTGVVNDVWG